MNDIHPMSLFRYSVLGTRYSLRWSVVPNCNAGSSKRPSTSWPLATTTFPAHATAF